MFYVISQIIILLEMVSGFLIKKSDTFFFEDVKFGGKKYVLKYNAEKKFS